VQYSDIAWLPLVLGLSGIGVALSWLAWKRRDLAAGLRGFGLSLMPIAAYLTGVLKLVWEIGSALGDWAVALVFSPRVWLGIILGGIGVVLLVLGGVLSRRRPGVTSAPVETAKAPRRARGTNQPKSVGSTRSRPATSVDSEFAEIEQILKNRGIN
jgi:hypothetical protein